MVHALPVELPGLPTWWFLNVFLLLCLLVSCISGRRHPYYSQHKLLRVGLQYKQAITSDFVHRHNWALHGLLSAPIGDGGGGDIGSRNGAAGLEYSQG